MNKTYIPSPIDTSSIAALPEEVRPLLEMLAKNTHENYVKMRIEAGWSYGPRSDVEKTNPTLIPYEDLSEEEKDCDRVVSNEVLKTILALGYQISRRE